ncbi:MAG: PD-(D/E)XK nuclease family protein [Traorella sp.]
MKNIYKENSILIVKEANVLSTKKKILELKLKGIKVITLNQYLSSFNPSLQASWTIYYEIQQRFKSCIKHLHYFKSNALSSEFIIECADFLNEMHFYHLTTDDLPIQNKPQEELKILLSSIYDLTTKAKIQQELLKLIPHQTNVYIDIQYPTYQEKKIIDQLLQKGIQKIPHVSNNPTYEWYTANNPRCEIEALAQKIIQDNLDIRQISFVYCDSSYDYLIASIFDRYQIPYHIHLRKSSSISFKCIALLEFAINPNQETFMNCLTQGCFNHVEKIIEAQQIYPYNYDEKYPDLTNIILKTELFSTSEIKQITNLLQEATQQKENIYGICYQLTHSLNYQELFITIDELLRKQITTKEEEQALLKVQTLFVEAIDYISENEDLAILIDQIKNIKINVENNQLNTVDIYPYSQINDLLPITFICGASQTTFNEFIPRSGIFDEDYVQNISHYPSLMERYDYAHQILIQKCSSGNEIIFSYPQSDYLGKNYEASLDIETITHQKQAVSLELIQTSCIEETITDLTKQTAFDIYTKNNILKGSISSLEKYVGCPYAYFLRYGCHIKEPIESGFNVQKIGTLNHSILEQLTNKYGKDYPKASIEEVRLIIDENIYDMKQVFPHLQFDLIRNRLIESMKLNLFILDDFEKASFMKPTYFEYQWHKELHFDDITLSLIGFVDRIDTSENTFCIIDYKSSNKKLEKEKVFSGQQLQLCTYLMQMKEELNLRPLGGFYYSFQNPRLNIPYQKISRRTKTIENISKDIIEMELIKKNRLQGWIFDENIELLDGTATHVNGVTNTKNKGISARSVFDLNEVSECIVDMMRQIVSSIISGKVSCEPNEAACLFCKYRPICRFNGSYTEKKALVELPDCMKKESSYE